MTETTERKDKRTGPSGGRHVGELKLRRLLAGESLGEEHAAVTSHTDGCAECSRRLDGLVAEQRAFEGRISFDRFAAGVERAARVPGNPGAPHWWARPASTRSFVTVISVGALAAVFALVIGARPLFDSTRLRSPASVGSGANRIKGAGRAEITFRIAPPQDGPQRIAATETPEPLAPGERIRVGVQAGAHRFLVAISIDDKGVVTPLYPEAGTSLPVAGGGAMKYLPDSLELTGSGSERLIVVLTDTPLALDVVRAAATTAFQRAGGRLPRLPNLAVGGEEFHRTFLKP
jgi:hypothetical protein